jgi:hypothetical protein
VSYPLGPCEYEARIRQSVNVKDHFNFSEEGKLRQSLNVLWGGTSRARRHCKLQASSARDLEGV